MCLTITTDSPLKTFFARSLLVLLWLSPSGLFAQSEVSDAVQNPSATYEYETKPEDPAFAMYNLAKAPAPGPLLLSRGDRLAICGDSITQQKMYSRMIETYLTVCCPELEISVRQFGWSGEKTEGFLRRMNQDCLTFAPNVATLCYGMNDSRYRPFDYTNGRWYQDYYTAIVNRFQENNVKVVVGSPGCAGRLATWVKTRVGTLDEHNVHLAALRDIALQVAQSEKTAFADIFWPMIQAQVNGDKMYSTEEMKYEVAGKDGIHPGWAGQVVMAYAFLRALGLDGDMGAIEFDVSKQSAIGEEGHEVVKYENGKAYVLSSRIPFIAQGELKDDNSVHSGMTLVPFTKELNRFTLIVRGLEVEEADVTWGTETKRFSRSDLESGINLMEHFQGTPFVATFNAVDEAVAKKQEYETDQIKKQFHSSEAKENFEAVLKRTEAEREKFVVAIKEAFQPVTHELSVVPVVANPN